LGIPRPQIGGAHDVGGVLRLVFGLVEIGRIASGKKEQADGRRSAEGDETNKAHLAGPRTSSHDGAPILPHAKNRARELPLKSLIRKQSK
jgi:hypothetical protein